MSKVSINDVKISSKNIPWRIAYTYWLFIEYAQDWSNTLFFSLTTDDKSIEKKNDVIVSAIIGVDELEDGVLIRY